MALAANDCKLLTVDGRRNGASPDADVVPGLHARFYLLPSKRARNRL